MRKLYSLWILPALGFLLLTGLTSCGENTGVNNVEQNIPASNADTQLGQFMDEYYTWIMVNYPENATYFGYEGQNDRWTDQSVAAIEKRQTDVKDFQNRLHAINRVDLSEKARIDYDLLSNDFTETIEGFVFPGELMPISQMEGVQQDLASIMAMMRPARIDDYQDIFKRLQAIPVLVDQTIVLMQEGLDRNLTPPRITLRDVAGQIEAQITDDPLTNPLLIAFTQYPDDVEEQQQQQLTDQAVAIYNDTIKPAYIRLLDYWQQSYYPNTVEETGIGALANGKAWYEYNARVRTTTRLSPDEIHTIGQSEVRRIRAQMEQIIIDTEFEGDFKAFGEFLKTDDQFFHNSADALLREYRDIAKRADAELPRLFGTLPRLPYGVSPIPDYAEKSQTTAYYQPGSSKAGRAGIFFANKYDLRSRPRWEMEALTLHEAVPGHHLQLAIADELENQHPLRSVMFYTAFIEGWGLYSESLGEEMGFYNDPYSKFGQLSYEMWRAIRLVVDTGMHYKGWSREEAIAFFMQNSPKPRHDIVVEIDRYLIWPGQALAYKIGELKIKELRQFARTTLGEKFNIRIFHDRVLENGAVPLSVLEEQIKRWVSAGGG